MSIEGLRVRLRAAGQEHLLAFWDDLDEPARASFSAQLNSIDLDLIGRLTDTWLGDTAPAAHFTSIEPARVHPPHDPTDEICREVAGIGEAALKAGRVGFLLVAGGQGTRLGFDGPKGSYPIGPVTGHSLFAYFADRIHWIQDRYRVVAPWYVMVGEHNEDTTRAFFNAQDNFGLDAAQIHFFKQAMMPCVDAKGRMMLDGPGTLCANPNGHGGVIPAFVDAGLLEEARGRGVDTFQYFQVDNYAVRLGDPYFIGLHIQNDAEFSAKVCRKQTTRESAGTFCICDGQTRVIEYTEVDSYPQLLDTDAEGLPVHFAANTAIHVLSAAFIERVHAQFGEFPWHCSHKRVPYLDETGNRVDPKNPNAYKFETFIFDSLEYCERPPVLLEIPREGEFAPVKEKTGPSSAEGARAAMSDHWAGWLRAAGYSVSGDTSVEISPRFAVTEAEFVEKAADFTWDFEGPISIAPDGSIG